ncbi:sugar phosphate isomerase/epimerase family protein [Paenibacillus cremeus]|uniref:sugar phosphate isomerase/epimerase family protein n=1 Tax=Paenibacillus cremeus TaxID=2163881 RepID=UPI001645F66A|nr:sugar phosphate isomerase/epimerase [Paenibacillus cremeus]
MIKLSCHSRNYGPGTPDEIFSFIRKLGFEYIDVDSVGTIKQDDVLEAPDKLAQFTKELADKHQLKLAEFFMGGVLVDGQGIGPSVPDPQLRERMLANFNSICRFAGQAGFRSIMGSAGSLQQELGFDGSFEYTAQTLERMVSIAAEHGVAFHVEPSRTSLLNTPSMALKMAQSVQGLKYTLDFLHFQINGVDQEETMQLLAHTGHMHARQAAVGWPKCPFEHGEIDYDRIVKRLRGLRWDGIIAMEFWNGPEQEAEGMCPVEQTIVMRYHLKGLIKKYY